MSEEQAVYDAVPDAVPVEDVVLTLAGQIDELRQVIDGKAYCEAVEMVQRGVDAAHDRIDKLQDTNLAPVLESSALLVELRRIAKAIETLNYNLDGVQGRVTDGGWAIRTMPLGVS